MSKIKWGEAALSLAVGYFGGKMMQDTGAPEYLYQRFPEFRKLTASNAGQTAGDAINKDLGLAAMAKVAYDAVVHHRLDQTSTSILIPYALGTVFDKNKGSSDGGAW